MPPPWRQPAASDPPPLPGGYKVGEKVFYTGVNKTFPSGNKLVHGQQGEVTGPATGSLEGKAVELRFPGNKGNVDCYCYLGESEFGRELTNVEWCAPLPSPAPPALGPRHPSPRRSNRAHHRARHVRLPSPRSRTWCRAQDTGYRHEPCLAARSCELTHPSKRGTPISEESWPIDYGGTRDGSSYGSSLRGGG